MLLYYLLRTGLWRSIDREKLRFFLGIGPKGSLSRHNPLWRHLPWRRAIFSPAGARDVLVWLRYRIELFDGQSG